MVATMAANMANTNTQATVSPHQRRNVDGKLAMAGDDGLGGVWGDGFAPIVLVLECGSRDA